jgi:hypothetical protein
MEIIMTTLKTVLSISSLAAILAMPLMLSGANASTTTKLMSCQANSKQGVVECCERILRTEPRPQWMGGFRGGCGEVVACRGRGNSTSYGLTAAIAVAPKRCGIYILEIQDGDGNSRKHNPQRSRNNRGGGKQ